MLATEHLLKGNLVTVKVIERILGLRGWALLFPNPALATLDKCYHFLRETASGGLVRLPPACKR